MKFQTNVFRPVFTAFRRKHLKMMNEPSKCLEKDEEDGRGVISALHGIQRINLHEVGGGCLVCVIDLIKKHTTMVVFEQHNPLFTLLTFQRFSSNSRHINIRPSASSKGSKKRRLNKETAVCSLGHEIL